MQPAGRRERDGARSAIGRYYERYWREDFWADNEYERWKLERIREHLQRAPSGARVLDVGCGDGRVLSALLPLGVRPYGVDVSDEAVRRAQRAGIESARADIDGGRLPVEDGAFDVVLCLDVLEHLFDPEHALGEMRRALAPGGRVVLAVPNGLNLFNRIAFALGRHVDVMDKAHLSDSAFSEHVRFFSREVLERVVVRAGLAPREREHFFPTRFSDGRFRLAPWLARAVTTPRLQERRPTLFALEFLYFCAASPARDARERTG